MSEAVALRHDRAAAVRRMARWSVGGNVTLVVGAALVLLVVLAAVLAPVLAGHDPNHQALEERFTPPGAGGHPLGTDDFGRDVWSRLLHGARVSLVAGVGATLLAAVAGGVLGTIGGYAGGWVDLLVGRVFDVLLSFPSILLAMAVIAALGASLPDMILAISIAFTPTFGRVMRGAILGARGMPYVEAARALGAAPLRIVVRHVLPNVLSPVLVTASVCVASVISVEAALSFLGLGVPPPTPTWGQMINEGKGYLDLAPWLSTAAGLAIMVAVLGFNFLGDGLRDALDPRLRR